jgi:hypothetical protein
MTGIRKGFKGSRSQGVEGLKAIKKGFKGSRVQGVEGLKAIKKGFKGSRILGVEGSRGLGFQGLKGRGLKTTKKAAHAVTTFSRGQDKRLSLDGKQSIHADRT